jgi:hypothetical protein
VTRDDEATIDGGARAELERWRRMNAFELYRAQREAQAAAAAGRLPGEPERPPGPSLRERQLAGATRRDLERYLTGEPPELDRAEMAQEIRRSAIKSGALPEPKRARERRTYRGAGRKRGGPGRQPDLDARSASAAPSAAASTSPPTRTGSASNSPPSEAGSSAQP